MQVGQTVTIQTDNGPRTGIISRVWPGGRTVTIKVPGTIAGTFQTWVRDADRVQVQA